MGLADNWTFNQAVTGAGTPATKLAIVEQWIGTNLRLECIFTQKFGNPSPFFDSYLGAIPG